MQKLKQGLERKNKKNLKKKALSNNMTNLNDHQQRFHIRICGTTFMIASSLELLMRKEGRQ